MRAVDINHSRDRASRRQRTVIAESVLTKHQLLILDRSRRRAPNLRIALCHMFNKRFEVP